MNDYRDVYDGRGKLVGFLLNKGEDLWDVEDDTGYPLAEDVNRKAVVKYLHANGLRVDTRQDV